MTSKQLQEIKAEIKDILIEGSKYIDNIVVVNDNDLFHQDCLITALKIYFYLANKKHFSKAYCSVGKFFLEEIVAISRNDIADKEASYEMGIDYSYKAIKLGNIHAMHNVGKFYYNNKPKTDVKYKELLEIAANAKLIESNEYIAKILISENDTGNVEGYLKFLSEENSGDALYRLGKISESKMQLDDAIKYYEGALKNNCYSASIELAKIYFSKYMNDEYDTNIKSGYILLAINILEKNYSEYSVTERKEVDVLLKNYKSLIYN